MFVNSTSPRNVIRNEEDLTFADTMDIDKNSGEGEAKSENEEDDKNGGRGGGRCGKC